jgi:hypothetical protein
MKRLLSPAGRDYWGGLVLVMIGISAAWQAYSYQIGSLRRMGAGFMPVMLGVILALCGMVLLGTAVLQQGRQREVTSCARPEWRGWGCICLSVMVFAVLCDTTGLAPATFACVFIAGLGDRENSVRDVLLLAGAITLAGIAVFWWGLGIVIPLFSRETL